MAFTVDIHHHILPDFFWEATNAQHGPVGGIAPARWSSEGALSFMDDAGIDVAVTSISTPGVHLGDDAAARTLARAEERGTAADTLRRLYWDTALSWKDPVLEMLRSVVGVGQVLYGSDFPYLRRDLAVRSRVELEMSSALTSTERAGVLGVNALKLLPRLRALQRNSVSP